MFINPWLKQHVKVAAYASNDKTPQLLWEAKTLCQNTQFSTVIAHNLGAFYPARQVSQQYAMRLQLDVEDFYPGEGLYFNTAHEEDNRHCIMQSCFAQAYSISYAAEGIAETCRARYEIPTQVKQVTIINSFCSADFVKPIETAETQVQCVWFSQHIGANRGLEEVFEAAKKHPNILFHLIGNAHEEYLQQFKQPNNMRLHPIMPQEQLHQFLSTMDIGLALESAAVDANRAICLTNKILAYAQAGLYILASPTYGQKQFLEALDYQAGSLIKTDLTESLGEIEESLLALPAKMQRWEGAKAYAWDVEQEKLMALLTED